MLFKRSSTRSYSKLNDQHKQGGGGRPSITDAFFAGDGPDITEMPARGASYFMGNSKNTNGGFG